MDLDGEQEWGTRMGSKWHLDGDPDCDLDGGLDGMLMGI